MTALSSNRSEGMRRRRAYEQVRPLCEGELHAKNRFAFKAGRFRRI